MEVEAYLGAEDPASHAHRGPTPRTAPMFGEVGHLYVYVSHGVYHCANVVARAGSRPAGAVLLRAAEPLAGLGDDPRALAGPGLLGRAFGLTTAHSGADLLDSDVALLEAAPVPAHLVGRSPRIGLSPGRTYEKPWRFYIRGSPALSRGPRAS